MPRNWVPLLVASLWTTTCQRPSAQAVPEPSEHALANLAAQHVVVLPTYAAHAAPGLAWKLPPTAELRRAMDADIVAAFEERGLRKAWIFPDQLQAAYRRNVTYATDPYALAEEPLRSPALAIDQRLPEPLASQIRTMVAFHEDARLVLAPVELVVEPAAGGAGGGRAVLRLVLMDARLSNVRWIGSVSGDSSAAFGPGITASVAAKMAGVVAPQ